MKTIYFIRHGSTPLNETRTYQTYETPLSERGRQQAEILAERFRTIPIQRIISSDMERAKETAKIIASKNSAPFSESSLFHELLKPTDIRGKAHADPEAIVISEMLEKNFGSDSIRHSDEENFFDLKKRGLAAIDFLTKIPESSIVVVTHGTFLKMIIALMLEGDALAPATFHNLNQFFYPSNTGITKCIFRDSHWWLIHWNDDAHLGELGGGFPQ